MKLGAQQLVLATALAAVCSPSLPSVAAADSSVTKSTARSPEARPDRLRYVPPITSPFFNEPPEITTEIKPLYILNKMPRFIDESGIRVKGWINYVGAQARIGVTDRIGIILTKVGWADVDLDSDFLSDTDGATNFTLGAKYLLISIPETNTSLTVGGRYEAPTGDIESNQLEFQGGGDGFWDSFLTFGSTVGDRFGVQASAGINAAFDTDHDASSFHTSVHADVEVVRGLFGVFEANMLTTIDEGDRTDSSILGSFEGYDLFNFGSTSSGTVLTFGLGARYRLNEHLAVGTAYEFPVTGRKDIIDFRVTTDFIVHL